MKQARSKWIEYTSARRVL